jgi:hypothetical protein
MVPTSSWPKQNPSDLELFNVPANVDPVSYGEVTLYTVFDRAQDHYLLMAVGWDGHKRVHAPLIHVNIIERKICR